MPLGRPLYNWAWARGQIPDTRNDLHWGEPTSARERWSAGAYIASTTLVTILVVLAVVFDQFAATGVLMVAFLSFILAYLIAPASEWLRHTAAVATRTAAVARPHDPGDLRSHRRGPVPGVGVQRPRFGAALARMQVLVPEHTARFVDQLHATEGWHETLGLPTTVEVSVGAVTRR